MGPAPLERTEELLADVAWTRRLAVGLVGDAHLADELAQETWLIASRQRVEAEHGSGRRRAFLAGVVRNLAAKARRGSGRRARHEERAGLREGRTHADGAGDLVARAALSRELVTLVMALDEPFRTAILLRYHEELSPREIARRQGLSVRTVGSRLRRGLEHLRDALDRRPGGRETWLGGAVALAGFDLGRSGGLVGGGILMGAKANAVIAAAVVLAIAIGVRAVAPDDDVDLARAEELVAGAAADSGDEEIVAAAADAARAPASKGARATPAAASPDLRVSGRATDDGAPELGIEPAPTDGARVRIWIGAEPIGLAGFRAADGVGAVERGAFDVAIDDPGYRPVHVLARVEGGGAHRGGEAAAAIGAGANTATLDVVRAHEGVLAGVVRDAAGAPVGGVRVLGHPADAAVPVSEATSEADGRFLLPVRASLQRLDVDSRELVLLGATPPVRRPGGGYEDAVVTIARAGTLVVRVRDSFGAPLAGATVAVRLAGAEVLGNAPAPLTSAAPPARTAATDADGVAVVAGVWVGSKLEVDLRGEPVRRAGVARELPGPLLATYDKLAEGGLLRVDEEGGGALVVPPARTLAVELRAPAILVVRGRVRLPGGAPAPEAALHLADTGRDEWDEGRSLGGGTADADGRFEARFRADGVRGSIAVVAVDGAPPPTSAGWDVQRAEAGGSKWTAVDAFAAPRAIEHGARVELDPRDARPDPALGASVLAAELELAPTLAISGRLVDEDGDPLAQAFGNRVYAVPAGVPHPYARTALGREAMTWSRDGTFRVDGLPDGVYDVYATSEIEDNFFSFSTGFVRVPGVPAGTAGLEVVVPRRGGVKVRLRVDCAEPLEEATVLIAAVQPRDGRAPAPSPAAIVARELASWPLDAPWDFAGGAMADTQVGREQLGLFGVASPDGHALPELGEGWYRFGLQPNRDADGERAYVPIATELVYLRPGEHEVRFELTPAAPLDGRLASKSPVAHLAVQLVDARGRAIPQPSGKGFALKLLSWVPLRADGSFRIAIAPVGPCTLRVGTAAELERGELRHEVEVDVRPLGEALLEPIEIRL